MLYLISSCVANWKKKKIPSARLPECAEDQVLANKSPQVCLIPFSSALYAQDGLDGSTASTALAQNAVYETPLLHFHQLSQRRLQTAAYPTRC